MTPPPELLDAPRQSDLAPVKGEVLDAPDLKDLATRIRKSYNLAMSSARKSVDTAQECGQLLREAKAQLPHGKWLPWLEKNTQISDRTARSWMRLVDVAITDEGIRATLEAAARPRENGKSATVADLDESPGSECVFFVEFSAITAARDGEDLERWVERQIGRLRAQGADEINYTVTPRT